MERNAIISSAELTTADRGLLTGWLMLDYGSAGQGFGGHVLYLPKSFTHHSVQSGIAGHWIFRVLEIAGVENWSDLKGKTIRTRGSLSGIDAIGHIVKDDWFSPAIDFTVPA